MLMSDDYQGPGGAAPGAAQNGELSDTGLHPVPVLSTLTR